MDARNPILMSLVGCRRRQAVNHQIFGRPAVAEAISKVDLYSTNAGDPVDQRQLRFARLQLPNQPVHVWSSNLCQSTQLTNPGDFFSYPSAFTNIAQLS